MFYGVVAKKHNVNRPIFIKVKGEELFKKVLDIFYNYNINKLPFDVRPVLTNIGSRMLGANRVYYIVDTGIEAFIDNKSAGVSEYNFIKDDDIFEVIECSESFEVGKDDKLYELILKAIDNDDSIKELICKNECKRCECTKIKIKEETDIIIGGVLNEKR